MEDRPTRIELPQNRVRHPESVSDGDALQSESTPNTTRKIHIKTPPVRNATQHIDVNYQAFERRKEAELAEQEAMARKESERSAKIRKDNLMSIVFRISFAAVVLITGFFTYKWYSGKRAYEAEQRRIAYEEKQRAEELRLREEQEAIEKQREIERRKREELQAQKDLEREQERQERDAKRREKEAAEEARRLEQEEIRKAECAKRNELAELKRLVEDKRLSLRSAKMDYWRNCPADKKPQSVTSEIEYLCVIPTSGYEAKYIKICAKPKNPMVVELYDSEKGMCEMSVDEFNQIIKGREYLIAMEGTAWICGTKKNQEGVAIPSSGFDYNPAKEDVGLLYEYIRRTGNSMSNLSYDIFFTTAKGESLLLKRANFGDSISSYEIKKKIKDELYKVKRNASLKTNSGKQKKKKRTVVFDDSVTTITKTMGGPTRIPRSMPNYSGTHYDSNGKAVYHYNGKGRETYRYDDYGRYNNVKRSTNANGYRESEYERLRAIAEKEDMEENGNVSQTTGYIEVSEQEVENIMYAGRLSYEVVK